MEIHVKICIWNFDSYKKLPVLINYATCLTNHSSYNSVSDLCKTLIESISKRQCNFGLFLVASEFVSVDGVAIT